MGLIPIHSMSQAWGDRALELATNVGSPYDIAFVRQRNASCASRMARWKSAEEGFSFVIQTANETGDDRQRGDATMGMALWAIAQGRFDRALTHYEELGALARRVGDMQSQCWTVIGSTICRLRLGEVNLGEPDGALHQWLKEKGAATDVLGWYPAIALSHLRAGRAERAAEAAGKALDIALKSRPSAYWIQPCIAAIAEVYLSLLELRAGPEGGGEGSLKLSRAHLEERAKLACKAARAFAKVFPIGEPFSLLWQGMYEALTTYSWRANETLLKCIQVSQRLSMPYEEGRAHLELGRRAGRRDPDRRRHLQKAAEIFSRVSAGHDLARTNMELDRG
jgi:tetratricopeptide (TPR) repeat protein